VSVNAKEAKQDEPLKAGDVVSAAGDSSSATVEFEDHTRVRLFGLGAPGGEAKLIIAAYDPGTKAMVLQLLSGLVSLVAPPADPPPARTIEANNTVTATQGTEVAVRTDPDQDTVSLKEGRVSVRQLPDGPSVELTDSKRLTVVRGKPPGEPKTYNWSTQSERELFEGPGDHTEKNF
jgi:hypothetical protein